MNELNIKGMESLVKVDKVDRERCNRDTSAQNVTTRSTLPSIGLRHKYGASPIVRKSEC